MGKMFLSRWLPILALPALAWLSYLAIKSQLAENQGGKLTAVHPPLWMFLLWGVTVFDGLVCYILSQRWQASSTRSTTRGSAHWATGPELAPYTARKGETALKLGKAGGRTIALSERRQSEHILLVAPQGKGKTAT